MRALLLFAAMLIAMLATFAAHAGTLDTCMQAEKDDAARNFCVENNHKRATNKLRELNQAALLAVRQETQTSGRKTTLREYRKLEAQHVRTRAASCRKEPAGNERKACEADSDYAHIERLKEFLQERHASLPPDTNSHPK